MSVLKFFKTFVFLRTLSEYLTIYGHGTVYKISFQRSYVKTDTLLYFFEYSADVLKNKSKVLDIFNTYGQKFLIKSELNAVVVLSINLIQKHLL